MNFDVGQNIKKIRLSRGLHQSELANLVGVTQTHISNVEIGRKVPSLVLMINISNALNCSLDDLVKK